MYLWLGVLTSAAPLWPSLTRQKSRVFNRNPEPLFRLPICASYFALEVNSLCSCNMPLPLLLTAISNSHVVCKLESKYLLSSSLEDNMLCANFLVDHWGYPSLFGRNLILEPSTCMPLQHHGSSTCPGLHGKQLAVTILGPSLCFILLTLRCIQLNSHCSCTNLTLFPQFCRVQAHKSWRPGLPIMEELPLRIIAS